LWSKGSNDKQEGQRLDEEKNRCNTHQHVHGLFDRPDGYQEDNSMRNFGKQTPQDDGPIGKLMKDGTVAQIAPIW
jgi:hypothetical protein